MNRVIVILPGLVCWGARWRGWDLDKAKFDKVDFRPGKIEVRKWLE